MHFTEFLTHVNVLAKRAQGSKNPELQFAAVVLDALQKSLLIGETEQLAEDVADGREVNLILGHK